MDILKNFIFIFLLLCCHTAISETDRTASIFRSRHEFKNIKLGHAVNLDLGTHVIGTGLNGYAAYSRDFLSASLFKPHLSLSAGGSLNHYERNLGIEGRSQTARFYLLASLGTGKRQKHFRGYEFFSHPASRNLSFKYISYLSTDGTGQNSGLLSYSFVSGRSLWKISYENDWFSFLSTDQYRTTAVDITYLRKGTSRIYGGAIGFKLWTGETSGLPTYTDKQFPMAGQYGSQYSHGIFYLSAVWEYLKISLGYDSEKIRDAIQNSYHKMIKKGQILQLDRDDKIYFQLSVNNFGTLY